MLTKLLPCWRAFLQVWSKRAIVDVEVDTCEKNL